MEVTFVIAAVIFTLLAIVVGTSLLKGSSAPARAAAAKACSGRRADGVGAERSEPRLNGHVPRLEELEEPGECSEMSGSSHDHWDVVKSVEAGETHPELHTEELSAAVQRSSVSTSSLSVSRPESRNMSSDVDPRSEAASRGSRRSFIGLSDTDLLKCAFSPPQSDEAAEGPTGEDNVDSEDSLRYVPGKARSHHLQKMMSKEELEEEQRVQREQLAAIFQLLKDNKDTFGDVSEGDMEEQLRLYSI